MRAYITEFIGTFFLVLTICLATNPNTGAGAVAPLAIGASLMIMVYMGGHISGAHYNPAVTLAVFMRGKLKSKDFLPYIVVQILGAILAAYIAKAVTGHITHIGPGNAPIPANAEPGTKALPYASGMCLLIEGLYTFALALVILNVATAKETEGNSFYGLAIGFTIVAAAFAGGGISGGAFNPAVGTGLIMVEGFTKPEAWSNWWIYLVGPLLGGAAAAAVFREQHPESNKA